MGFKKVKKEKVAKILPPIWVREQMLATSTKTCGHFNDMKVPDGNSIEVRRISQSRCHAIVREDVGIFSYSHMTSGLADRSESKVIYGQKPSTNCRYSLPNTSERTMSTENPTQSSASGRSRDHTWRITNARRRIHSSLGRKLLRN